MTPEETREHIARYFEAKGEALLKKDGSYGGFITASTYRWVASLVRKCPLPASPADPPIA